MKSKKTSYIKILPLLVMVALLSFSVRVGEVFFQMSALSDGVAIPTIATTGSAFAEDAPKSAESKAPVKETGKTETQEQDVAQVKESNTPVWRDANDLDPSYLDVKSEIADEITLRREVLEKRERELETREALLKAAEQELDRKYKELKTLREDIVSLLDTQSEEEMSRIVSLRKVYENMKPKDAARIFDTLDLDILIAVVETMSERKLSPILAAMNPERARTMTIMLAEQKQLPELPSVY